MTEQPQAQWQPQPVEPPGTVSLDQVQRMIDQALERQAAQHKLEMDALRQTLTQPVSPFPSDHPVPTHAGGIGHTIAQTWSMWEQELASKGEHPLQRIARDASQVAGFVAHNT